MSRTTNMDWQENLSLDAQQRREVFARFGLAMHNAQCLEKQLGLMLASMYNRQFLEVRPEARDAFYDREFTKTLGRMVRDLKDTIKISPTLEDRLNKAVEIRNWLAHHYFYQCSRKILTWWGRECMISELQERADFLQALDAEFTELMMKWMEHVGVSKKEVHEKMRVFFRENDSART